MPAAKLFIIASFMIANLASSGQGLKDYQDIINIDDDFETLNSNIDELKSIDLSHLWVDNETERRFGFIGTNFRRLRIIFLSIIKNPEIPNQYFVYGKSNVADNICPFQGTITIKESYAIKSTESPDRNTGILAGEYRFYEDPKSKHAGIFDGRFVTYWYQDKRANIKYNDLWSISASYNNNQFAGTWTEHGKKTTLTANWGDGRIPQSGDLDVGTSEFGVNQRYEANGWASFNAAWRGGNNQTEREQALKEENEKWWTSH